MKREIEWGAVCSHVWVNAGEIAWCERVCHSPASREAVHTRPLPLSAPVSASLSLHIAARTHATLSHSLTHSHACIAFLTPSPPSPSPRFLAPECLPACLPWQFGNIEVLPPHNDWPVGRIFLGTHEKRQPQVFPDDALDWSGAENLDLRAMHPRITRFLEAQRVQKPVALCCHWLTVGHVDEIVSAVPSSANKFGFKVLLASPRLFYEILDALPNPQTTTVFRHKFINFHRGFKEMGVPGMDCFPFELDETVTAEQLSKGAPLARAYNKLCQDYMDYNLGVLAEALNVARDDPVFVHVPVLYQPGIDNVNFRTIRQAQAVFPDLVNHLCIKVRYEVEVR